MADFPAQPEQLTTGWLTDTLRASGALAADRSVSGFEITPVGAGTGLLGMVMRIHLRYDGGTSGAEPASLVVKFSHPVEANRAIAMNTNMYAREVSFFHDIAGSVDVPKPFCHYAAVDVDAGENIVLLEDLGAYRAGDQVAGVSADDAKLIIDAITPLHAAYWGTCDTPLLADFMRIDSSYAEKFPPSVYATWENCLTLFPDAIADDVKPHVANYVDHLPALHAMMGARTQTVVHGDVRLDNVMFGGGQGQHPVMMVDWQAIMVSNPLHDLSYLLSQSLDTELRRAHEAELVEYYYESLRRLGVGDVTLQECWDGYDVSVLFLFSYPLIIGGFCQMDDPRGVELAEPCSSVRPRRSATETCSG